MKLKLVALFIVLFFSYNSLRPMHSDSDDETIEFLEANLKQLAIGYSPTQLPFSPSSAQNYSCEQTKALVARADSVQELQCLYTLIRLRQYRETKLSESSDT